MAWSSFGFDFGRHLLSFLSHRHLPNAGFAGLCHFTCAITVSVILKAVGLTAP